VLEQVGKPGLTRFDFVSGARPHDYVDSNEVWKIRRNRYQPEAVSKIIYVMPIRKYLAGRAHIELDSARFELDSERSGYRRARSHNSMAIKARGNRRAIIIVERADLGKGAWFTGGRSLQAPVAVSDPVCVTEVLYAILLIQPARDGVLSLLLFYNTLKQMAGNQAVAYLHSIGKEASTHQVRTRLAASPT
jgi:hypothetical protein